MGRYLIVTPHKRLQPRNLQQSGFTLIELVTVVVILAIVTTFGTGFIISTMESYTDTQDRSKLINRSRQAIEQTTRRIRGAAPNSIRITNGGNCLEFLPLASGGNYINPVPDTANGAPASNSIATAPHTIDFGTARYVLIGAQSPAEIYGGAAIATLAANTPTLLTLSSNKTWLRNSPARRFFLTDDPQAICLSGNDLRHYTGYASPLSSTGTPGGSGTLMADNASSATPFAFEAGTETRGAVVVIDLIFTEGDQRVPIRQEVFVRNAP